MLSQGIIQQFKNICSSATIRQDLFKLDLYEIPKDMNLDNKEDILQHDLINLNIRIEKCKYLCEKFKFILTDFWKKNAPQHMIYNLKIAAVKEPERCV